MGFRKGADIDEEMWPAESFGGVSDEQFWDDMASDKPLTTTARTAQQEAEPKNRLLDTGTATNPQGTRALGGDRSGGDRGRASRDAGAGRRATGSGAYPGPRTGPDPAAERTAIQPAYAATQPVKNMAAPVPGAPPPFQNAPQPVKSTTPPPGGPKPVRAAAGTGPVGPARPTGPTGPAGQPRGASAPPAETGRRQRPNNAEEDPLTSTAFSLRQRGPVDGRSSFRSRDQQEAPRGQNDAAGGPGRGPASPYGHTAPYPPAGTSYDDASSATQMMSTPPSGENYGYGSGGQADHPRRQTGARSHARPSSPDERARPSRPAYPQDTRPASGSYPAGGAYQENGYRGPGHQPAGHQGNGNGNGSRGNGHRAPYDPRDDYRRLTHQRLPSRLGSCPRETLSGTPPGACTRDWRGGR